MIDVTNGSLRVVYGGDYVSVAFLDSDEPLTVIVYDSELPWLINTLGDAHREILQARQMEMDAQLSRLAAEGEVIE